MAELKTTTAGEKKRSGAPGKEARYSSLYRSLNTVIEAYRGFTEAAATAETAVIGLETELLGLDAILREKRVLSIETAGAVAGLREILDMQAQIGASSFSSPSPTSFEETGFSGYEPAGFPPDIPESLAAGGGSPFRERPVSDSPPNNSGPAPASAVSFTLSSGSIVIHGANKSPEELAAAIVKPLDRELSRLGYKRS